MIKGIFCVLTGFFCWACFCYLPFGIFIIISILDQPEFDLKTFSLFSILWVVALLVVDKVVKEQNK